MEGGFEKGIAPSKSTDRPRLSSPDSGENNENDSSQYQVIPKFQNHKKMVITHSTSTTAPRKKILGERNGNLSISDAQNQENHDVKEDHQDLGLGESEQASSSIVLSNDCTPESGDKVDAIISEDSLAKGYDPLTNCLLPRPKYLRFNPNRRAEILHRLESKGVDLNRFVGCEEVSDEEKSLEDEVEGSSFPSTNESFEQPETGNAEEANENISDESDAEEEEELKGEMGCLWGGVLKHMLVLIACLLSMSCICPMNNPTAPSPAQQSPWNFSDGYLMIQKQTLEILSIKMYDAGFFGVEVEDNYGVAQEGKIDLDDRDGEANEDILEGHGNEETEDKMDDGNETGCLTGSEFVLEDENFEQLIDEETDEIVDIVGVSEMESEAEGMDQSIDAKAAEHRDIATAVYAFDNAEDDSNNLVEFQISKDVGTLEEELKQNYGSESSQEVPGLAENLTHFNTEFGEIGYDDRVEMQKLGWSILAVAGVFVVSLLLAASAFFHSSNKDKANAKASKPVVKKKPQEEKVVTTVPPLKKKVEFLARSSRHLAMEAPRELNYRIHAPAVELIGEIVVGERKSVKNSRANLQMSEFKESNGIYFPNNGPLQPQPVLTPIQARVFEYSTSPHSHGRFTTEKAILKKEEGQSGEAAIQAITTPSLRRSSRLRSRAMSP